MRRCKAVSIAISTGYPGGSEVKNLPAMQETQETQEMQEMSV